jgi:hypothetical protein
LSRAEAVVEQREESFGVEILDDVGVRDLRLPGPPVDVRAAGRAPLGLDLHPAVLAREQVGPEQVGDHARVVQRRPGEAVPGPVETVVEVEHPAAGGAGRRAERAEALQPLGGDQRLVGHVEPEHRERGAAAEDRRRRVRVDVDVELRGWGHVAQADSTTHEHDPAQPRHDVGRLGEGERHVRERPDRAERHRARGPAADDVHDRVHRVLVPERHGRLGQLDAVQAGGAVDVLGRLQPPEERPGAAGVDRHIRPAAQLDELPGVAGGERQRDVAGDGGHCQQLDLIRAGQRQQECHRVVLAGVAVDDNAVPRHRRRRHANPPSA